MRLTFDNEWRATVTDDPLRARGTPGWASRRRGPGFPAGDVRGAVPHPGDAVLTGLRDLDVLDEPLEARVGIAPDVALLVKHGAVVGWSLTDPARYLTIGFAAPDADPPSDVTRRLLTECLDPVTQPVILDVEDREPTALARLVAAACAGVSGVNGPGIDVALGGCWRPWGGAAGVVFVSVLGQSARLSVRGRVARTEAYMRALMVPRVSPALLSCASAIAMAVERTASSATAWSTMPTAAASDPP